MAPLRVLISHSHNESELAGAWKSLLQQTSQGMVDVWYSSDRAARGGMDLGREWRETLSAAIARTDFVIAILTPESRDRPWVLWECGLINGRGEEVSGRGRVIPVTYSMKAKDLENPLASFQVYAGDRRDAVGEVCERLARAAGIPDPQPQLWAASIDAYLNTVAVNKPRRARTSDDMALWQGRIEELVRTGRKAEVHGLRQQMYRTFGADFKPMSLQLHDLLGSVMYDTGHPAEVIEETAYSLNLDPGEITTLHRRSLAYAEMHDHPNALASISQILQIDPSLSTNTEIGGAIGRLRREAWRLGGRREDLQAAFDAYNTAAQANRYDYFCALNAAGLAFELGQTETSAALQERVLRICSELRKDRSCSFWADFSVGEILLGQGRPADALAAYTIGLDRSPAPSAAHKSSAMKGVLASAERAMIAESDVAPIRSALQT